MRAAITAIGGYLPPDLLTNADLEKMVDTNDEWIRSRTGISERHILKGEGLGTSDMAVEAVKVLCEKRGISPMEIDLLICATVTPDHLFPATANIICDKIGAKNAWGYDLGAACSGFLFAVATGSQFIETGKCKKVVVVGADKMSSIVDYTDRATCVLFGDGAGAVVLKADSRPGILATALHADGAHSGILSVPGSICGGKVVGSPFLQMDGQAVFKFAVRVLEEVGRETMAMCGLGINDIDWLIPHQANVRILEATAKRLGLDPSKLIVTVDMHANTSAASVPLALDTAMTDGRIKEGHRVLLEGVGGGFTWGAALVEM